MLSISGLGRLSIPWFSDAGFVKDAVALAMTKWPMLAGQGFWYMAHESRTDWSMMLGSLYLLIAGTGPWSLDARTATRLKSA